MAGSRTMPWGRNVLLEVRRYRLAGVSVLVLVLVTLVAIFAPWVAPYSPTSFGGVPLSPPSGAHLLGTDELGRDVLSRVMYGGRISMSVAIGSVLLGGFVGTALGLVSGYVGGVIDNLLMRLMDALLAFPSLVVAIVLVTALKASLQNVIIAIAITAIPTYARLMRGQVLVTKEREYIEAARALGLGELRIMARHVTPNSVQIVIIQASINAAGAILTEASLSFLGFGVPPPTPTWGGLLHDSYPLLQVAPWIAIVAGAAISVASLSFTFIGNAVRDLLDPRARIF